MSTVTRPTAPVNDHEALPELPAGLVYKVETYNNQHYISTGGFNPNATTRQRPDLRWLGTLIADFDLVDWLGHVEDWEGDKAAWKKRMYERYAGNPEALADVKARHLDDVLSVLEDALDDDRGVSEPTYLVDSGWGIHAYFWLSAPVQGAGIDVARAVNKRLVERINARAGYDLADKGVHDAGTRIIRLIGSMNTQAKEKAGIDFPLPVVVIRARPGYIWELDEKQFGGGSNDKLAPFESAVTGPVAAATSSDEEIRVRMNAMRAWLLRDKKLCELYDACGTPNANSETDESLACALAARRVPVLYIANLVHLARGFETHHEGTDYWMRTAISAWNHVRGAGPVNADDNYGMMHPAALLHFEPGMSTLRQAAIVAQHDPRINGMLWTHEHTRHVEWATDADGEELISRFFGCMSAAVPALRNGKREFDDQCSLKLVQWFEQVYGASCLKEWREVMSLVASALPKRNPLLTYLEECHAQLDQQAPDLLETWLLRAFPGLEDTPLLRAYSKKWAVGGAARAVDPGVFIKAMLVIVGGQSAGKTSMFRLLGGAFYDSPHTKELLSKDSVMASNASWLLEMEEMDFLSKNTIEAVKKYVTTQVDRVRLPYGRDMTTMYRACFYAGTANRSDILSDGTGNDRFWCIELPKGAICDFDAVAEMRNTLWGQAYAAWLKVRDLADKERIAATNLTREELELLRAKNQEFERTDALHDSLLGAFWRIAANRQSDVLPLRATWHELTATMFPGTEHRPANMARDLDKNTEWRFKGLLEKSGFSYSRRRPKGGAAIRAWFAPEEWNERYKALLELQAADPTKRLHMPSTVDEAPTVALKLVQDLVGESGLIPLAPSTDATIN